MPPMMVQKGAPPMGATPNKGNPRSPAGKGDPRTQATIRLLCSEVVSMEEELATTGAELIALREAQTVGAAAQGDAAQQVAMLTIERDKLLSAATASTEQLQKALQDQQASMDARRAAEDELRSLKSRWDAMESQIRADHHKVIEDAKREKQISAKLRAALLKMRLTVDETLQRVDTMVHAGLVDELPHEMVVPADNEEGRFPSAKGSKALPQSTYDPNASSLSEPAQGGLSMAPESPAAAE